MLKLPANKKARPPVWFCHMWTGGEGPASCGPPWTRTAAPGLRARPLERQSTGLAGSGWSAIPAGRRPLPGSGIAVPLLVVVSVVVRNITINK